MTARFWSTAAAILVAAAVYFTMAAIPATREQCWTAAVTALCACLWIFESLPLAVTSLLPLVIFPLAGVLTERRAASSYGDPVVLLFMGGFILSKAVEQWGAHRRIAQITINLIGGTSGRRIVLGVMLATTLISMWISNTAVALMMLPVAIAILERDRSRKLAVPLLLGVAYSASIGGIATPIGTAPNGVFLANYEAATGHTIQFPQFMLFGVPIALMMLVAAWLLLTFRLGDTGELDVTTHEPWTTPQKRTLFIFGLACLGWITREIPYGGWSQLLNIPNDGAGDMTVAIAAAIFMFLVPSGTGKRGERLLDWPAAQNIPWGILILFGGGIAIAHAFEDSGLSELLGKQAQGLSDWPTLLTIGTLSLVVTFFSEFTSNTATANILMPILAAAAKSNGMNPAMLMIPATLANNLAFMMPVGTPPNAIAYGTGHVTMKNMARAGFMLNLIGVVIVTLFCWAFLPWIIGL